MFLVVTLGACGGGGMSPEPSSPSASTGTAPWSSARPTSRREGRTGAA